MDFAFSVAVSATNIWRFPPLVFCFWNPPCRARERSCVVVSFDALPFIRRRGRGCVGISQPEEIWSAKIRIAGSALFCDLQKAERDGLANCGSNGMAVDTVLLKVIVADGKFSIISATMAHQFNFDPVEQPVRG